MRSGIRERRGRETDNGTREGQDKRSRLDYDERRMRGVAGEGEEEEEEKEEKDETERGKTRRRRRRRRGGEAGTDRETMGKETLRLEETSWAGRRMMEHMCAHTHMRTRPLFRNAPGALVARAKRPRVSN